LNAPLKNYVLTVFKFGAPFYGIVASLNHRILGVVACYVRAIFTQLLFALRAVIFQDE
jgi:hypothetical protein